MGNCTAAAISPIVSNLSLLAKLLKTLLHFLTFIVLQPFLTLKYQSMMKEFQLLTAEYCSESEITIYLYQSHSLGLLKKIFALHCEGGGRPLAKSNASRRIKA